MKANKTILAALIIGLLVFDSHAQNVGINSTGTDADQSSILDLSSTSKGFLLPRVADTTTVNSAAEAGGYNLAKGLMIYDLTDNCVKVFDGFKWTPFSLNSLQPQCLDIIDFGAKKNDLNFDNTSIIQQVIDSAAVAGGIVCIPAGSFTINSTLEIPAGVTIQGVGIGDQPLQTPNNTGSNIRYLGTDWAIKVLGTASSIKDLCVYNGNAGNNSGIHILGDGNLIENVLFDRVLIFGFEFGTALKLEAIDAGAIAYSSFYDVRIRHAKVGFEITQNNIGFAFVNSNSFYRMAISGGGFDYGAHIKSGNNNVFHGLIVEPTSSTFGHLVIDSTSKIVCHDIRIEASNQTNGAPLLKLKKGTIGTYITGIVGGNYIFDMGANSLFIQGNKMLDVRDISYNVLQNTGFTGFDNTLNTMPYWTMTNSSGTVVSTESPEILSNHNVLKFNVSGTTTLKPTNAIDALGIGRYNGGSFGVYVKTSTQNAVIVTLQSDASSQLSSMYHPGDGEWHFISVHSYFNNASNATPIINISNASDVEISTPTFSFGGHSYPQIEAPFLSTNGGTVHGMISTSVLTIDNSFYVSAINDFISLPKNTNTFIMETTRLILRINQIFDQFAKGTIITLLFDEETNGKVVNSGYINLKGGSSFDAVLNSSLTLLSNGNGTWREVSRNN